MKYDNLHCPSCPHFSHCRGSVSKGSSYCDKIRGVRGKKKNRRFNYLKEMIRR